MGSGSGAPGRTTATAAALAAACTLLLTACLGGSPRGGADADTGLSDGPQPGEAAELTVLSQFGDNPALQGVLEELNDAYQQRNPDVTVTVEHLTLEDLKRTVPVRLSSGAGPDVIDYDAAEGALGVLARSGLVLPLDEAAERYGWDERLPANALARTTYDGDLVGVARSSEAVGLFYNADLFEELGIAEPTTYERFEQAAEALRAAGVTPITFGNKDLWPSSHLIGAALHAAVPLETLSGVEQLSGTGSWTDPAIVEALQLSREWVQRGWVTPDFNGVSFDDASKRFFAGEAGMFIEGTGLTPDLLENMPDVNVRFVPFPMVDDALPQQAEGGVGGAWAVSASSEAPAVAADWIDFIHFSDEAEQAWLEAGVLPTTDYEPEGASLAPLVRDNLDVVQAALGGGGIGYWTGFASSPLVEEAWMPAAQAFLDGSVGAEEFAAELQEALTEARAQADR